MSGETKVPGHTLSVQLAMAVLLCMAGITLLFMGFWCSPQGEIHNSVLIGFGEVSTFAGALFGVDYSYRYKEKNRKRRIGRRKEM